MPQGMEIYNDSTVLQIGSDTANFYMVAKGSVSVTITGAPAENNTVTLTPGVTFDNIVLNTNDANIFVLPSTLRTGDLTSITIRYYGTVNGTYTINYWLFRSYRTLSPATSGVAAFEVYNADGTVAFTSTQPKLMRCLSKIPISSMPTPPTTSSFSIPSSLTIGWLLYGQTLQTYSAPGPMGSPIERYRWLFMRNQSGAGIGLMNGWGIGSGRSNGVDKYTGGLVPIDVTGY